VKRKPGSSVFLALCIFAAAPEVTAEAEDIWIGLLADSFAGATASQWMYAGVSNTAGEALLQYDPVAGKVSASWDQTNLVHGTPNDPYILTPSRLSRTLPRALTDQDTFRFGATLVIAPGTVPDTEDGYEIANIGLYGLDAMGPDRMLSDDWSGNTTLIRNGSDFVEFNYFIMNAWGGPNMQSTIGGHVDSDSDYRYVAGSGADPLFHDSALGIDHWLPEDTNLYVEVIYYGSATNAYARRAYAALYTEPERTNILTVHGVEQYYWTQALSTNDFFCLTDVAFFNHVGTVSAWGNGVPGAGEGTFEELYVDFMAEECSVYSNRLDKGRFCLGMAVAGGSTYAMERSSNLASPHWTTVEVYTAESSGSYTWTNTPTADHAVYRVHKVSGD
jgi:hypothetical protein